SDAPELTAVGSGTTPGDSNDIFTTFPLCNYVCNLGGPALVYNGFSGPIVPCISPLITSFVDSTYANFAGTSGPKSMASVLDGSSNTAMWSEAVTGSNIIYPISAGPQKRKRMLYQTKAGLTTPGAATVLQFLGICQGLPGSTLATDGERGVSWQAT